MVWFAAFPPQSSRAETSRPPPTGGRSAPRPASAPRPSSPATQASCWWARLSGSASPRACGAAARRGAWVRRRVENLHPTKGFGFWFVLNAFFSLTFYIGLLQFVFPFDLFIQALLIPICVLLLCNLLLIGPLSHQNK